MKELTSTFNTLLQDKRVRGEQSKYENITRQRSAVNAKYKKIHQEFLDLEAGLDSAKQWYSEMKDTVDSLDKNVDTFVNNRRSEGAQLLSHIEQERAANASGQADRERERLRGLMERMSMDPTTSPSKSRSHSISQNSGSPSTRYPSTNISGQYQVPTTSPPQSSHSAFPPVPVNSFYQSQPQQIRQGSYAENSVSLSQSSYNPGTFQSRGGLASPPPDQTQFSQNQYLRRDSAQPASAPPTQTSFNPNQYGRPQQPTSPPPNQTHFAQNQYGRPNQPTSPPPTQTQFAQYGRQSQQQPTQQYMPHGYIPPPPPPGPPPLGPQQTFQQPGTAPVYGNPGQQRGGQQQQHNPADPWAGLSAWK